MRYIRYILVLSFLVALFGCKVGPNYQPVEMDLPTSYYYDGEEGDTILNLEWWELFDDPRLEELITQALVYNRNVRQAAARIQEARAAMRATKADTWPYIGYEGSALRTNYNPMGGAMDPANSFFLGTTVNWELDFWGKYRRATEAARAELMASEYAYRSVMISLISEVASTYFELLSYEDRLEISKQTLETRQSYLEIVKARFEKGIVPEIDLNQAEIQESIAARSVPAYERLVALTGNAIKILTGQYPGEVETERTLSDQPLPPDIPSGIPSQLMLRRPDVMEAEQLLAAQTARIGVAQAMRFPSISLTGMLGMASTQLSSITMGDNGVWSVSAGLFGPIFNFGKNKRRVEIERQRTEQALMQYEQTVLQSMQDVENALVSISTYKDEYEAIQRQTASARNASELSRARYDGGVTSYLEVLDSERTRFEAELIESDTYQKNLQSYVALYKALGGGWISREEKQSALQEQAESQ